jgi:hypothetical protein
MGSALKKIKEEFGKKINVNCAWITSHLKVEHSTTGFSQQTLHVRGL